jgi:hypothetical protein
LDSLVAIIVLEVLEQVVVELVVLEHLLQQQLMLVMVDLVYLIVSMVHQQLMLAVVVEENMGLVLDQQEVVDLVGVVLVEKVLPDQMEPQILAGVLEAAV